MSGKANDDQQDNNQLMVKKQLSYDEIAQVGKAFVASGMFGKDIDRVSKAITKIMAGQELGLAPFASMRAVHVIEGNATLSANTMAGMVKSSGRYDYTVIKKETDACVIDFYEYIKGKRTKIGTESFDHEEAKAAGLLNKQNWQKYPKAMMFARCISNGVRSYCPDVFSGMLVYTPDELNARVSVSGDVIDGEEVKADEPDAKKETTQKDSVQEAEIVSEDDPATDDVSETIQDDESVSESNDSDTSENEGLNEESESKKEEIVVDDEYREMVTNAYNALMMPAQDKSKLLREATGKLSIKNLTEDIHWKNLHAALMMAGEDAA